MVENEEKTEELILINSPIVGQEWYMDQDKTKKRKVISLNQIVETQKCEYQNCIWITEFDIKNNNYVIAGDYIYKRGIGLIRYRTTSNGNTGEWKDLSHLSIN